MLLADGTSFERRARLEWEGEPTEDELREEAEARVRFEYEALIDDTEPLFSAERDNREPEDEL